MIITHNGIFHADEVFAIATLIKWGMDDGAVILRTRDMKVISHHINKAYIVDVGGEYDVNRKMFDHHHDKEIEASNMLLFTYLLTEGLISLQLYDELYPFMKGISDYDTNHNNANQKWGKFNSEHKFRNLSNIIGGFNRDPEKDDVQFLQFDKALSVALEILDNEEDAALSRIRDRKVYEERVIIGNNIAVFDKFCSVWKEKKEHMYAILPNPSGWSLNTADSSQYPLPEVEHPELVFAHKGRFISIFKTKEAAIEVALTL